jgi:DNA-3-methyladenine glycosylase
VEGVVTLGLDRNRKFVDGNKLMMRPLRRLRRSELPVDTVELAQYLIGKTLIHESRKGKLTGRIVETEAYVIGDAACHAFCGPTERNASLFLQRGHSYVYMAYGTSFLFNVSSEKSGIGAGVLVRALEPLEGIPLMQEYRGTTQLRDLTRGPGRLAEAMGIDKKLDGLDLCTDYPLWLGSATQTVGAIHTSVRIGITKAAKRPLRFFEYGNPFVSGPRRLNA